MGRKSTKENKNIYQITRENLGLTREAAADQLGFMSDDRIEKIESEKLLPRPEEVLRMAEVYKKPELCNHYCACDCPIGEKYVPLVEKKELSQITLELISMLNKLETEKARLVDITVDGVISDDELSDFEKIKSELNTMAKTIDSLSLWVENAINNGQIKNAE